MKNHKIKGLITGLMIYSFVFLSGFVFAQEPIITSSTNCTDNATLQENRLYIFYANGVIAGNMTIAKPTLCSFGCDMTTQQCSPNPFTSILIFIGLLVVLSVVAFYFYKHR